MVALRIELSATRISGGSGLQPSTTGDRLSLINFEFAISDFEKFKIQHSKSNISHPSKSGTSESNRKPQAPKAHVLPSAPLPVCSSNRRHQMDELGVEPSSLDCKSKRRSGGKPQKQKQPVWDSNPTYLA